MKKLFFFVLLLGMFTSLSAKRYISAEIEYEDGSSKIGYVGFPIYLESRKISFKSNLDASSEKLKTNKMVVITFAMDGDIVQLAKIQPKYLKRGTEKIQKSTIWAIWYGACHGYNIFDEAYIYKLNKENELLVVYPIAETFYYIKRNDQKYAFKIAFSKVIDNAYSKEYFRNNAKWYFKDKPKLIEKLENKEVKSLSELFEYYCQIDE